MSVNGLLGSLLVLLVLGVLLVLLAASPVAFVIGLASGVLVALLYAAGVRSRVR